MAMDVQEIVWFVCVTIGLHTAVVGGLNVGLALIETRGLFKEAKIQRRQKKAQTVTTAGTIKLLLFLYIIVQPVGLPVFYAALKWRGMDFSGAVPPLMEVLLQISLFLCIEDTAFYWIHRLLHTPFLYKRFHKLHHSYYQPTGLSTEYFHPVEYTFGNAIPLFLGPFLLKSNVYTMWVWLVLRLLEGVDGHCGYDFWFMPLRYFPFRPGANVHDYHHTHNVGNYGSFFTFWDTICGTDMSYVEYKERERVARYTPGGND